jgi:rubrerythrin
MNKDWEIQAKPVFTRVICPKHRNDMTELENGWFGNPVWWCKECGYPYELKLTKMKKWSKEGVEKQLKTKIKSNE